VQRRRLAREEELLERASRLIAKGWCQRSLAEDLRGRQVEPWSESACRWSPLGALTSVWYESPGGALDVFQVAYAALSLVTGGRLEDWNAEPWRTKWHVLNAFDRARGHLTEAREEVEARVHRRA
jgi:hypothetical protein